MTPTVGLRVRVATEDDLDQVCALVNHFIVTTTFNFRTEPQTVDEWRRDWGRLHRRFPWLVATDGDRVVGMAYAAPWKERAAYQWTAETTVYVDPSVQRRGVAGVLYRDLLDRLRRQGFRNAIAVIGLPNDASVRLHERHGFVPVALLPGIGFKHGGWHDVGFWQVRLQDGTASPEPPSPVAGA